MTKPKRRPADPKAAARVKPSGDSRVERVDMELADGRYLLVFSRKPNA